MRLRFPLHEHRPPPLLHAVPFVPKQAVAHTPTGERFEAAIPTLVTTGAAAMTLTYMRAYAAVMIGLWVTGAAMNASARKGDAGAGWYIIAGSPLWPALPFPQLYGLFDVWADALRTAWEMYTDRGPRR